MAHRAVVRATDRFERKREAILDAATLIMNRRGVKGLTLGVTAAAVDLSTTSVTYYFKRKDDLAAACMSRGIDAMLAMVDQALAEQTPRDRLHRLLALYLERVRLSAVGEAPPLPALSDLRALNQPQRGVVSAAFMKVFRRLRQIFESPDLGWLSRGRRTARTHMLLEQLFWAARWLPKYDPEDYSRVRERMFDILVGGMASETSRWGARAHSGQRARAARPPGDEPRDLPAGRHAANQLAGLSGGFGGQDLRRAQRHQGQLLPPQRGQG